VSQIHTVIEGKRIAQVIILDTMGSKNWIDYLVETVMDKGCRVLIYNNWEEMFDRPLTLVREGEHTFFAFQEEPLENPISRFVKRAFDLAVSVPVCLLVLPPLYVLVALIARFQSPGPVLYRQTRCGRGGQFFTIFKFRSMHLAAPGPEQEAKQAVRGDARVYPLGRFLRRFSLDELPQFLNVLRGDMSVVGPRPHLPQHDEMFAAETKYYRTRFFVKPGITGLAQVKGYRGEIVEPSLLHERVRWDLAYVRGWSIWLDVLIAARTIRHMLFPPRSAY
jgi:exopolysaccharide biosynthesis polyprenyl glycosylphosphotransferase